MSDKKVDLEWKKQAREERERMAKEVKMPGAPPHASISLIISSFVAQTLIALGEIESPVDGKRHIDLDGAKFSIDLLQVLSDKTQGNLSDEEKKMLDSALYDLRMRYVQKSS